ncbi:MAG: phosphatidylinositol-specific phospholipase C domain-containing protein [Thermincola sp.]|jgi:hypothetical protein|nr:phosphatidylinositol-specific phospholipase C domain-containing protein [Thermincola sp.]MDT3701866.1 phosphatidylinositol-specific phospholipase C domain-containing protein [Thermincola sp.]
MRDVVFGLSLSYGEGVQTSVAINNKGRIIEVHKPQGDKKLQYHTAELRQMDVLWGSSREYDEGVNPSIALNDHDLVVEIHKAQFWHDLWYHVGQVNGDKVDWGPSQKFNSGDLPSVALTNDNWCVEVHKSQGNAGLWYHVGNVDQKTKAIAWGDSRKYDDGDEPKVAMNNKGVIVEVHKSAGLSTLWYHVGIIEKSNKTINWGPSHQYDNGVQPSVAITDDGFVIEVHKSQSVGTLYRHVGVINVDNKVIEWSASEDYDTGSNPSVAVTFNGSMAIQTHQSELSSNLWFSTSLVIDRMRWMESQYDTLRTKPLWQVTLPGSHDSGAYNMGTERVHSSCFDAPEWLPGSATRLFATAHNQDIAGQLQNGCRFFDLRPYYKDEKFYAYHDVLGANFEDMLDDVADFLNNTSRELVILKVSHFCSYNFTDTETKKDTKTHEKLVGLIKKKLGDKMYANMSANLLTTSIGEFVGQGSKVIVWYDDHYIEGMQGFWREISIFDSYSDTDECCKMECDQLKKMIKRSGSSNKLFLLSWTLTFKDLNSLTKGASLQTIAAKANRGLGRFLAEYADDCQVNVLYVDFLRDARVTDCAIILNR